MLVDFKFSDIQATALGPPAYRGAVPDAMFPGREWMEGELAQRPIHAPHGAFYITVEGVVWLYLCPPWQVGLLANRPRHVKQGTTWRARDTNQIFVWMEY